MKIVIDCYHISKEMRGMGIYLDVILNAIKELPEINFYLVTNNNEGASILRSKFANIKNVNIKNMNLPLPIYEQIMLPIFCFKIKSDFIISSGNTASIFGIFCKQILLIHDVYYLKKKNNSEKANSTKRKLGELYRKLTMQIASKKAYGVITVSEFAKNDIVKELKIIPEKIAVIHNGVNIDYSINFEDLNLKNKRILMVSGSSPQKNLPSTIRALTANSLINNYFEGIDIIGVSSASELGLEENNFISYHGHVDRSGVKKFYQQSSHFILPSLYESFGIPAIEALMAGCDVYLSNRGAMHSLLGDAGSFYDPLNKSEESDIVMQIANSKPLTYEQYCKNQDTAHKYTWDKALLAFKDYLDAL